MNFVIEYDYNFIVCIIDNNKCKMKKEKTEKLFD